MKLYTLPPSPNSIKVMALAYIAGIDLQQVPVDVASGQNRTPDYLAKNPNGVMPTLEDGEFVLWESNAILAYLAQKAKSPLYPTELKANAELWRWMSWGMSHWNDACVPFLFERLVKVMFRGEQPDQARLDAAVEPFAKHAAVLDAHLGKHQYVVGDSLTIADLALAAPLVYAQPAQIPWEGYKNIQQWYGRIAAMPEWQKAVPQMAAR